MKATSRSTVTRRSSRAPMSALSQANNPIWRPASAQRGGDGRDMGVQGRHLLSCEIVWRIRLCRNPFQFRSDCIPAPEIVDRILPSCPSTRGTSVVCAGPGGGFRTRSAFGYVTEPAAAGMKLHEFGQPYGVVVRGDVDANADVGANESDSPRLLQASQRLAQHSLHRRRPFALARLALDEVLADFEPGVEDAPALSVARHRVVLVRGHEVRLVVAHLELRCLAFLAQERPASRGQGDRRARTSRRHATADARRDTPACMYAPRRRR